MKKARTYYHYASDELGSITQIVNEKAQRIENVYEYDGFGNIIYAEERVHNPFRYTGQQYDSLTGLYYLRARFYNPATARFTQEDSYYGDGLNLYTYCNNNPMNYYDPEGHEKLCPKGYIKKILNGKDVEKMTSKQKGNFGELLADYKMKYSSFLKAKGYDLKNINSGRVPQGLNDKIVKGIDGIYMNKNINSPIRFVIDEAKFGKSQLGKVKGNIKQMSDQWIKSRILKAVGGDEKLEKKIIEAFKNKQVDRVLTKINKNGEVVTYKLDSYGNIIGEWP